MQKIDRTIDNWYDQIDCADSVDLPWSDFVAQNG